ncbi:polyprenyl synthetase family protein [Streptomyces sp. NBC_00664]|uniref:polyprenyl synthetase family protein n=1 Tax=Streptomyces sp. NBC_00664 TaxID=2975802 RepID=UPI003FA7B1F9
MAGGSKRLRPVLCVLGWLAAAGGEPASALLPVPLPVLRAAASLELLHAFALIHDDVMDGSDLRRGRPTVHRPWPPLSLPATPRPRKDWGKGWRSWSGIWRSPCRTVCSTVRVCRRTPSYPHST